MIRSLDALRERYLRAQIAGDRREAVRVVVEDGLAAGVTIRELQTDVVRAAQQEIGRLWQLNLVSVAQEHMATAISQLVLSALFERAAASEALERRLVIGCVEGERHEFPARLVADYLELAGFEVRYLGADVPHDDLVAIIRDERPHAIGLSVTMSLNVPALREAVSRIRVITDAPIMVGGAAVVWAPRLAAELGVELAGASPEEVLATARRLARVTG